MKVGLVMEGGAMRGMFTAGVIDVLMENDVTFDGAIGVSAGAVFGCNYKSQQPGRAIRYNKRYCRDKRYVSLRSLFKTGNLYNEEFGYHKIPEELDPFDAETFRASPMAFYVVATNAETGKAVYHKCTTGIGKDLLWMQASASMPLAARLVEIDGRLYSDGGVGDSIPVRFFQSRGYLRNVVILTQPAGFVKKRNRLLPLVRLALKSHPALVRAMATRHWRYNATLAYIRRQERAGKLLVIRPPKPLRIGRVEHDPQKLEAVYQLGRQTAQARLGEIQAFIHRGKMQD